MGNYINLGNDGFRAMRKGLYVDKSGLISVINGMLGTGDKLSCVSRPRRFGKSYAAKMLSAYYDRSCDSRQLFNGLEIEKHPSFEDHLNKYDVLYLDITWFISTTENLNRVVKEMQDKIIAELRETFPQAGCADNLPETLVEISSAIDRKFIVIIDEWDALFREAKDNKQLQKEYLQLLRGLFKSGLTDKMIEAAYMTGILPIKKYGTQSALTDFIEYTMLKPGIMAEYMGFTEAEVKALCDRYNMDFAEAKSWYDGYVFHKIKSVYNPNSVVKAMKNQEYSSYWTESETYESLKIYIDMDEDGLKETIVQMLGGAGYSIDVGTFQNDMITINSRDDVLTLLVHLGYLAYDASEKKVFIPNKEVHQEFMRAVKAGKHREIAQMIINSDKLLEDTLDMDAEAVALAIENAHSIGTAPMFYNNEQALRSVIRFAYISCAEEFQEIQELPSGRGYADIVYLPKKSSSMPVWLIELKWNKTAEGAIRQIKNNNYPQVLEGLGSDILLVGINYDVDSKKHSCVMEKIIKT